MDKKWHCVDVTWSNTTLQNSNFKKDYNLEWVFTDPTEFSKTHYPMNPRWQLVNSPLTQKEFWKKKASQERKYNSADSLQILLEQDWIENKTTSIKGEFIEQKNKIIYLKNLNKLGWELTGGSYNLEEIKRAQEVFNLCEIEYNKYAPFLFHKNIKLQIKQGRWLCQRRIQMKE